MTNNPNLWFNQSAGLCRTRFEFLKFEQYFGFRTLNVLSGILELGFIFLQKPPCSEPKSTSFPIQTHGLLDAGVGDLLKDFCELGVVPPVFGLMPTKYPNHSPSTVIGTVLCPEPGSCK